MSSAYKLSHSPTLSTIPNSTQKQSCILHPQSSYKLLSDAPIPNASLVSHMLKLYLSCSHIAGWDATQTSLLCACDRSNRVAPMAGVAGLRCACTPQTPPWPITRVLVCKEEHRRSCMHAFACISVKSPSVCSSTAIRTQYSTFIHRHSGMSMLNGDRHEEECFSGPCMMASCHGALC